ncbi:hypothetical protein TWF718_009144 [Orbilia javanica]|uniref:Uncharacterized protein n=1 Tax=Orbilia javanica TaxID=47235 RepID=A0AAN8MP26_9PEZI
MTPSTTTVSTTTVISTTTIPATTFIECDPSACHLTTTMEEKIDRYYKAPAYSRIY